MADVVVVCKLIVGVLDYKRQLENHVWPLRYDPSYLLFMHGRINLTTHCYDIQAKALGALGAA